MFYSLVHAEVPNHMANMHAPEFPRTHSFLGLVEADSEGNLSKIFKDEIHFTTDGVMRDGSFYYSQYFLASNRALEYGLYWQHLHNRADDVQGEWDKAVAFAKEKIAGNPTLQFDRARKPESADCRAGAIAVLRHLGVEYHAPHRCTDTSGTQSDLWERLET